MPKIIIIGAGFGGLSCALELSHADCNLEIIVIDKKETFDFLPSLPDTLGRGINPQFLASNIEAIAKENGFEFIKEEVLSVDFSKKEIYTNNGKIGYDYLVIASGSETNFYGNDNIKNFAYTLDNVDDAKKIISALKEKSFDKFIISGGGYTGIEVATNLRRFFYKKKKEAKIIIVEKSKSILGPLPEWMKNYTRKNLARLDIEVFTQSAITRIEGSTVYVSGQEVFDNALVVWAAGVKTAKFIQELNAEKNTQGRLMVDNNLRLNDNCFAIGDAADVNYKGNYLRMAVQFAIVQGNLTAKNIIRSIKHRKLVEHKPIDLGYIIPMANNYSCGNVFGVNLKGKLPTLLHFSMCIYRTYGFKNKIGFLGDLLKGGAR
ncbi:MAG: FAD-dependent oxidoreductase [Candidatus Omnitrophica bacterium]|jgi:NADH dehydrogenase|nr:FAD-dependent oxidoreductase [Candidatus Omnitrophota bacterium]